MKSASRARSIRSEKQYQLQAGLSRNCPFFLIERLAPERFAALRNVDIADQPY
jgi:hypothetical protein